MADGGGSLFYGFHRVGDDVFHRINGLREGAFHAFREKVALACFDEFLDRPDLGDAAFCLRHTDGLEGSEIAVDLKVGQEAVRGYVIAHAV